MIAALILLGCAEEVDPKLLADGPAWADVVLDAPGADPDEPFGDPTLAVNGARGSGPTAGGMDVYSLRLDDRRPHVVVGWSGRVIVDGPGADLVVFENAFDIASGGRFMDPTVVSVSADGETFAAFPHATGMIEATSDPADWIGFAGVTPTQLHVDHVDGPTADDPSSGGDRFDLADLPDGPVRDAVLRDGVLAVRLEGAGRVEDPATGDTFPTDPVANGPDIDAVYAWSFDTP